MTLKKKFKILIVSQYFPPEIGAGSSRAFENAKRFVKLGAEVTVLTNFPNYPNGVISEKYKGKTSYVEFIDNIKVIRVFTYATPNKGFFKRSLAYFSFMVFSAFQGVFKVGFPDVIIATSPPFFVGISGFILSFLLSKPFVFEVRDLWPESIVQLGQVKNKTIINIMEKLEVFLYKKATKIISVTDSYIPIIANKGIDNSKIEKITNGVDIKFFNPIKKDLSLCNSLMLQKKFVVSYLGTLGLAHALEKVLDSAKLLENDDRIHFLFIGDGAERDKLKNKAKELMLQNVTFLGTIEKKDLAKYYSISDVLLVPLRGIPLFKTVIPSKIFEIMAMKKPLILSVNGESKKIIEGANSGIVIEPENFLELKNVIELLSSNKKLCAELGENGRMFVKQKFNRDILAKNYLELLKNIIA